MPSPTKPTAKPESDPPLAALQVKMAEAYRNKHAVQLADYCSQTLAINPGHQGARQMLASAFIRLDRHDDAERLLKPLVKENPNYALAWAELGRVHQHHKRRLLAMACWQKALQLDPHIPDLPYLLGIANFQIGRPERALPLFRRALQVQPDEPEVHTNLAFTLLLLGQWEEGFREYEWRWKAAEFPNKPLDSPRWQGEDLTGKTLLVVNEQGLGDTIQFARYLPQLQARGARVLFRPQMKLTELMQGISGANEVIHRLETPEHDFHISLMSLPGLLDATPANVPAEVPYLKISKARREQWQRRLDELAPRQNRMEKRIGLVWRTKPISVDKYPNANRNKQRRSVPLEDLARLLDLPFTRFFALQIDTTEQEKALLDQFAAIDLSEELHDMVDTGACMQSLDLIISIDSVTTHLAGALALPVWNLLIHSAEWRWQREPDTTIWYPTARLYRQASEGQWNPLVTPVGFDLLDMILNDDDRHSHTSPGAIR